VRSEPSWVASGAVLVAVSLVLSASGCSQEAEEKVIEPFESSLPAADTVAELKTGFSKLCNEVVAYRKAQLEDLEPELLCTARAMSLSATEADCAAASADCQDTGLMCSSDSAPSQCALTVDQLSSCVSQQLQKLYATRADVSCAALEDRTSLTNVTIALLPEACGQVVLSCPELLPLLGWGQ
jgi:hypothetical protein